MQACVAASQLGLSVPRTHFPSQNLFGHIFPVSVMLHVHKGLGNAPPELLHITYDNRGMGLSKSSLKVNTSCTLFSAFPAHLCFSARMKKGSRENFMTTKAKVNITYSIKTI